MHPNILFITVDACRLDYAKDFASTLTNLGGNGLWFENAISPSTWTLPSHASLFTGTYPHEHGVNRPDHNLIPTGIVKSLGENGYSRYCVSGNAHMSPRYEFTKYFDRYTYTRGATIYPLSFNPHDYLRYQYDGNSASLYQIYGLLQSALENRGRTKNFANVCGHIINHFVSDYFSDSKWMPHPILEPDFNYSYNTAHDAKGIKQIIRSESNKEDPFFIYSNMLTTHYPYTPPRYLEKKHIGDSLDRDEVKRLNDEVAHPWEFTKLVANETVNESDVKTLQDLYAGSVEEADRYIGEIVNELKQQRLFDNTLIIVTADHGEVLGEADEHGRRWFGHGTTTHTSAARVPLVILHPNIQSGPVSEMFSIKDLYSVIKRAGISSKQLDRDLVTELCSDHVFCEIPAVGGEKIFKDKHPNIGEETINRKCNQDTVMVFNQDWKIVVGSTEKEYAIRLDELDIMDISAAPSDLIESAHEAVNRLQGATDANLDDDTQTHLEDLGYL